MDKFLAVKEETNNEFLVNYFEVGCLCLLTNKIKKPKTNDVNEKAYYYISSCTCSRHPESAKRACWDKNLSSSEKSIMRASIKNKSD